MLLLVALLQTASADTIRILVWDEQQPQQSQAYENFIGNEIAARLESQSPDFEIRSVRLDDAEQGLAEENLDWADVLIWWGHVRQAEVSPETAQRKIIQRIQSGSLDVIFLHSAHWATPFVEAMNARTKTEARLKFPDPEQGPAVAFEFIAPVGRNVPHRNSLVTPAYLAIRGGSGATTVRVDLPNCCFPAYRSDGKPSTIHVVNAEHPIAEGLPRTFTLLGTEMYDEPFHVPEPDEVVFEERWEGGEHFRSGMVWSVGKGKVFYFRPGHETYPIFKQREVIRILANACRWLAMEQTGE